MSFVVPESCHSRFCFMRFLAPADCSTLSLLPLRSVNFSSQRLISLLWFAAFSFQFLHECIFVAFNFFVFICGLGQIWWVGCFYCDLVLFNWSKNSKIFFINYFFTCSSLGHSLCPLYFLVLSQSMMRPSSLTCHFPKMIVWENVWNFVTWNVLGFFGSTMITDALTLANILQSNLFLTDVNFKTTQKTYIEYSLSNEAKSFGPFIKILSILFSKFLYKSRNRRCTSVMSLSAYASWTILWYTTCKK